LKTKLKRLKFWSFMPSYLRITLKYFINVLKLATSDILCGIIVCK